MGSLLPKTEYLKDGHSHFVRAVAGQRKISDELRRLESSTGTLPSLTTNQ